MNMDGRQEPSYKMPLGTLWSLVSAVGISCIFFLTGWPTSTLATIAAIFLVFVLSIVLDIVVRDISSSHSWRSAFDQYLALNVLDHLGSVFYWLMVKDSRQIGKVQEQLLLEFLAANVDTEYGAHYKFSDVKSREDFVRHHPLTVYSDVEPYIERMKQGESRILTSEAPKMFAVTSGTSGKTSVLPFLRRQQKIFFLRGISVMSHCMIKTFPETGNLRKGLKFFYSPRLRSSPAGIPIGPNSSSPASTKSVLHLYTTPFAGYSITTEPETLYVHLLFALNDAETGLIEANFASLVYFAFSFLEKNWKELVNDILHGSIKQSLEISSEVRSSLNDLLKPNVVRAEQLQRAFKDGFSGIAKRIWPKMSLVLCVDSGAFANYATILREIYCKGIPIYSPLYAATEGLIGLNIWPEALQSRYLLVPRAMFVEFIRIEDMEDDQPKTLFMDQVELNASYELVLTNASGLCRYRFGDVVRVTDFLNQCPIIEFLYRKQQLLNVRGEKLSERTLFDALRAAVSDVDGQPGLVDYTTCESLLLESFADKTPRYGIFVELASSVIRSAGLARLLTDRIDNQLQESSFVYKSFRMKESIGLPEVFLLKPGSLASLRQYLLRATDASANQVKIPRVLRKPEQVQFLMREC